MGIDETIDDLLARETTGISELNATRDAAIKAITDAYTEGMSYYEDLDISPEAWTKLSAAPIRKAIDTLYSNIVEGNQRSRGTMAVRPVVNEAFSTTVTIAAQSVKDASAYGANLAAKRADLLAQKGSGVASTNISNQTAIQNLRANTTGLISGLRGQQVKYDWDASENEKNRALQRVQYASNVMPDSAKSLYESAELGDPILNTVYKTPSENDPSDDLDRDSLARQLRFSLDSDPMNAGQSTFAPTGSQLIANPTAMAAYRQLYPVQRLRPGG